MIVAASGLERDLQMVRTAPPTITSKDRDEYGKCKYIIREHSKSWMAFAEAVKNVRDGRLYLVEFDSFNEFCDANTPYEISWVNRLIEAYEASLLIAPRGAAKSLDFITSAKHWLALKEVSGDRIDAVLKRIDKEGGNKPVTTALIQKAIYGPSGKPQKAQAASEKSETEDAASALKKSVVDGAVLSRETVTSTVKQSNDRPVAITDGTSDVVRAVDPVDV